MAQQPVPKAVPSGRSIRALAAAALAAAALDAAAYLPPSGAILKRVAQRRGDLALASIEVRGTATLPVEAARRLGLPGAATAPGAEVSVPALVALKIPGRCRLELLPDGVPPAERPAVSQKAGRMAGHRGLETVPAARALVEGLCTLLGEKAGGVAEPGRPLAQALVARGVAVGEVALGRLGGRIAWVIGGRPQEQRPQAWIDKQSFQPVRLVALLAGASAGAMQDVRLVDFGSPVGGDQFPRALEVWLGPQLQLRFAAERVTPNPRIPDVVF